MIFSIGSPKMSHQTKLYQKYRRAMQDLLPPDILRRPKKGFNMPVAKWLTGPLEPLAADLKLLLEESPVPAAPGADAGRDGAELLALWLSRGCAGTANRLQVFHRTASGSPCGHAGGAFLSRPSGYLTGCRQVANRT